jgi:hypothetical protein
MPLTRHVGRHAAAPLEGVSVRMQVTNWQYAADLLLLCRQSGQVWDEILEHRTEGHNLAEMERRNDATNKNSLEHRSHQRRRGDFAFVLLNTLNSHDASHSQRNRARRGW